MINIRRAADNDFDGLWPILRDIIRAGETYALDPQMTPLEAKRIWFDLPLATVIAIEDGQILGTYMLKPNQAGNGGHVCNCGYMVTPGARGRGVARSMCNHSQEFAYEEGFLAMQFNLVVSTNHGAIRLWQKLGFKIVGTLPCAFAHPTQGLVDAHIMYKWLENSRS